MSSKERFGSVHALNRLVERVRSEQVVYRYSERSAPDCNVPGENVRVEWVTTDLVGEVLDSYRLQVQFYYYLALGHSGILAHDGRSWIAYGWICKPTSRRVPNQLPDWLGELDLYWLFSGRTRTEYRRRGWHKYLLTKRIEAIYAHDPGASIFTDTRIDNVSRHSMVSTGFDPAGMLTSYRLPPVPITGITLGWWDWNLPHPPLPDPENAGVTDPATRSATDSG